MTRSLNCTQVTPSVCDRRVSNLSPLSKLHTCVVVMWGNYTFALVYVMCIYTFALMGMHICMCMYVHFMSV